MSAKASKDSIATLHPGAPSVSGAAVRGLKLPTKPNAQAATEHAWRHLSQCDPGLQHGMCKFLAGS
jgi:hypothetical protein